jgi:hypothetical protein
MLHVSLGSSWPHIAKYYVLCLRLLLLERACASTATPLFAAALTLTGREWREIRYVELRPVRA